MATTTTAPMTLEEFERLPDDGNTYEINEGELITLPGPKFLHSRIVRKVFKTIEAYLDKSDLGESYAESDQVLSLDPLTVRRPDISFLSNEQIRSTAEDDYVAGAPELAIEVVSPSQPAEDLQIKVRQYLRFGAKQVWVLYPKTKSMEVHRPGVATITLEETETLTGGDLLPGFSVKVSDFFV
ncbi:MAG TPA: Uma2 family endonuclease [Bryobacteraceae bacterium]|nr:Uma2 family endonuclease [Bryobacteraceae bacterium]